MVRTGNQKVHLMTQFHAVIDGTNGDTLLQPVTARFGNSIVNCRGGVIKEEGLKGKSVILDVQVKKGRIEDMMKFAIPGKSPLVGAIQFSAKFKLPPGDLDVLQKLDLNGSFTVDNAEFTSNTLQEKIDKLSMRSRGIHDDQTNERIVSDMKGSFDLGNGSIKFSSLSFMVPGTEVSLIGDYNMVTEDLNFTGTLKMDATLSETQTGMKKVLLKLVDPFFKKGTSGAVIPIKITGKRSDPSFGLNL
jgi:hypothetical protein